MKQLLSGSPKQAFFLRLLLIVFFSTHAFAQTTYKIQGYVSNFAGEPLIHIQITDTVSGKATFSQKNGSFTIETKENHAVLCFKSVGYETLFVIVKDVSALQTLPVKMKEKSLQLETVEINASAIQMVYKRPSAYILDFEFYQEGFLLLLEEKGRSFLRHTNTESETISELSIKNNARKLFTDCFNNIQVIYDDSIYEVYQTGNLLSLGHGNAINIFNKLLLPCMAATNTGLIFSKYLGYNQSLLYYTFNQNKTSGNFLYMVSNKTSEAFAQLYTTETMIKSILAKHPMDDNDTAEQRFLRTAERDRYFTEKVLHHEIYSPLLIANDSIFIFDHVSDSGFVFCIEPDIKRIRKFPLQYKASSRNKNRIITDDDRKNIFLISQTNGVNYIHKIDLTNGKIYSGKKIVSHLYPEKLKIKGLWAFYIYRDRDGGSFNYLYRQKIE